MRSQLSQKWIMCLFFLVISGFLIVRRFDLPTQETVRLVSAEGSSQAIGHLYKRGETITTKIGEHIFIQIGSDVFVAIDERTSVELWRVSNTEQTLKIPRGRMVVKNKGATPVKIETYKTESILAKGKTIFINYSFVGNVTIAPVTGMIQTHVKGTEEYMNLPVPINISEKSPFNLSKVTTDPTKGVSAAFHQWADEQFDQR